MNETATRKTFRHYMYFLFGQQFSMLGSMIVGFVITWWITVETQNPIYLSISVFLMFIPQIVVTPLSGVISDRWNRKMIILFSDSAQAAITFALFMLFLFDVTNIWLVLSINTMRAVLFAFQLPTVQAIIPVMIPQDKLSRINGINFLFSGLIQIIGPMVSALLLAIFPITLIFFVDIGTFLIALVPLLIISIPSVSSLRKEPKKESFFKDFKAGLLIIRAIPGLLAMIAFAMIFNFLNRPFAVLMPYFINVTHGGTAFDLALIFTISQAANITGALITSIKKNWKHKIKINILGASLFFAGYMFYVFAPPGSFLLMAIGFIPGAIVFPITVSTYLTILQKAVPRDKIGRVMSIDHMISMAIAPIGALIAGPLAEFMGIYNLFFISAVLGISFPFIIWVFTRIRELEYKDLRQQELHEEEMIDKTIFIEDVPEKIEKIID